LPPAPPPLGGLPQPPSLPPPPLGLVPAPPNPRPITDRDHSPSPSPPPPSKPSAIPTNNKNFGIKMSLGSKMSLGNKAPLGSSVAKAKQAPKAVSSVFNNDSSDEEEEIPHEARYKSIRTILCV